jgi:hypothetical protein
MTTAVQNKANLTLNKVFTNKFKLTIPRVGIIGSVFDSYSLNVLELNVKGAVAPGLSIEAVDLPVLAHKPLKVTGAGYKLDDIEVKFLIDGQFVNYYLLWSWLNKIYNTRNAQAPVLDRGDKPYVDILISALDNYNNEVMQFKYRGAFITGLSKVDVDYENANRIEASATFSYDDFELIPVVPQ